MGNTTSSAQAQQRIAQIQSQSRNECSALSSQLSTLGESAMKAEKSSRAARVAIGVIIGVILGSIFLTTLWFLAIVLFGLSVMIGYSMRLSDTDKNKLTNAINALNNALNQNSFLRNSNQNAR